ncbi:putative membrane protein [Halorhabdus tiamatea SARL4B]|uniref:Putative membrane protein n=1 Tax=Halorhabdus tiamatea SARL4B TaxID=1033806 RepID=F7PKL2_9EURY|nr:DUF2061 domain-containing protein [Halorhabdus tiamatea]ERJ05969.1 putative membrane protein [Halorhabdus tiamatea SARL4B]CCQ33997.1 conserved hypothetical protein (DUF2061) [Halorhabdus tiamatea SARL4B]
MDKHRRSIVKAASYRLFATSLVFLVAFVYTGQLGSSAKIGLTAAVGKTALYYVWERLWANIQWGVAEG